VSSGTGLFTLSKDNQAMSHNTPAPANDNLPYRTSFTGNNEWHTPCPEIELARAVLGSIDIDPASNTLAQQSVQALTYYTIENSGLDKPWYGKVWLNPPYAKPLLSHFVDKLVKEREAGHVTEAIVLTHNFTETKWFQKLAYASNVLCFPKRRIRFISRQGERGSPTSGQTFFYLGTNSVRFTGVFGAAGMTFSQPHEAPAISASDLMQVAA